MKKPKKQSALRYAVSKDGDMTSRGSASGDETSSINHAKRAPVTSLRLTRVRPQGRRDGEDRPTE